MAQTEDNTHEITLDVDEVRAMMDELLGDEWEDVTLVMDEAQGQVHMGSQTESYVVIKIVRT